MFSMVHTIVALSAVSLMTSYSNSCHPRMDSSIRTWLMRELRRPRVAISTSCPMSNAVPPPSPPSVKAGRMRIGQEPISSAALMTSSIELQAIALEIGRSIDSQTWLNNSRSSALSMASRSEPISSTFSRSKVPSCDNSLAMFSAVWPPIPAKSASGFSISKIFRTVSGKSGSMYTLSAISGSFCMVAGLEFTRMTSYPSSRRARTA